MLSLSYCSICHDHLNDYGEMVCEIFEKICSHVAFSGSFMKFISDLSDENNYPEPSFSMIIRLLEGKGYIVTTDIENDVIQIKPKGMHYEEIEDSRMFFFCLCNEK